MPIICIEGPPAVGKTTVSLELADTYGCYVVPDALPSPLIANKTGSIAEWRGWYDQQIHRWQLALKKSAEHAIVVLDGDIFQPLITCGLFHLPYFEQVSLMFQQALMKEEISFPDRYYYLYAGERTLRKRATMDTSKVVTYTPKTEDFFYDHWSYYNGFSRAVPGILREIQASHERQTAKEVMQHLPSGLQDRNAMETFEYLRARWM